MPGQRQREPGRVVRIPLGDGFVGWGRQLRNAQVEFFERFDREADGDAVSVDAVVDSEGAFTVAVMDRAFRRSTRWMLLGVVPLSEHEESEVYRSFKQDALSGALSIYWESPDGWGEDPATRSECAGLERAAVWDPEHVEERLRDLKAGRPSRMVESLALKD